jgi:hypothetical protein
MSSYLCKICSYTTFNKSNFNKHLNTKKHLNNEKDYGNNIQKIPTMNTNDHFSPKNDHKMTTNDQKSNVCTYCNKIYSSKAHKRRHELHYCKKKPDDEVTLAINQNKSQALYIKELEKQIDKLLDKVGTVNNNNTNNIINQTNNIQINNYGSEDLSHITNAIKTELLKIPFGMIPKLVTAVHFNELKPENNNLRIPNKRDNKIRIYINGKWVYKNKKEIIKDMIDSKYTLLDDHYNSICDTNELSHFNKKNYNNFSNAYDNSDKNLMESIVIDTEMEILNSQTN